jgi:hypothetical protein
VKRHAEPQRVVATACAECGLPFDQEEQERLMDLVPPTVQGWVWCPKCQNPTHPALRRVIAEEAERREMGEGK